MYRTIFHSGETKLAAVVNLPYSYSGKIPCVIFCHGYTSYKDEFGAFTKISDAFCRNDIGTFRFDFRGCGESAGGGPKGRMLCGTEWIEDVYSAYHYVRTLSWVDTDNIILLGMSMGGAAVLSTLKLLPGLKKAIAVAPVDNGYEWLRGLWMKHTGETGWVTFLNSLNEQRQKRIVDGMDEYAGVEKILAFKQEDYEVFLKNTEEFPLSTAVATWSSAESIVCHLDTARELSSSANDIPVLFIHGTADTLVPYKRTEAMYNAYPYKKELLLLEGKTHGLLLEDDISILAKTMIQWVKNDI